MMQQRETNTARTFESEPAQRAFDLLPRNRAVLSQLILVELLHQLGHAHRPLVSQVVVECRVARVGFVLEKRAGW